MSAQSPKSYVLSGIVHGSAVALLLIASWVMQRPEREPSKVLDLVAGEGDNWSATEAPALGSPGGDENIKVPRISQPMPKIDQPAPEPTPAPPQEQPAPPIEAAPLPQPERAKPTPSKPTPQKTVVAKDPLDRKNFVKDIKRLSSKREKRLLDKFRREQAAEQKRISEEEFRREHAAKAGVNGHYSKIDAKGIAKGVEGGSTSNTVGGAGGKALSVAQQRLMDQYFAFLKQKLRQAHVPPPGVSDKLTTTVEFFLSADGRISSIHVVNSSGNADFDQSVLEAFKTVRSIGPRPDGQSDTLELDFNTQEE